MEQGSESGIMSEVTLPQNNNPYVGPRAFTRQEEHRFFGRDVEAQELLAMVTANQLLLFYAPSGAGKSSLVNTKLIPGLESKRFEVLPVGRVGGTDSLKPSGDNVLRPEEVDNPFVYNLILSLDQSLTDPGILSHVSLSEFLINLVDGGQGYRYVSEAEAAAAATSEIKEVQAASEEESLDIWPRALIIDQFEEILTTNLQAWNKRADFFKQLGHAMDDDPFLWVILTLREDFVAALDPYAHLMLGSARTRYYMPRMGVTAALEAIEKPAELGSRPFATGVAHRLVDNLRQIQRLDESSADLGQYVEPVQLQVVCFQLWQNLSNRPLGPITEKDLTELGDVDTALAQFYEQALANVLQAVEVSELELRNWFERQLITEAGTRGLVYQGSQETEGMPNQAVDLLAKQYLIRVERRGGGTWYELIHDRFVRPIRQSNQSWRQQQSPLVQAAGAWERSGRKRELLYGGPELKGTLAMLAHPSMERKDLGPVVQAFLQASEEAQSQRDLENAQLRAEEEQRRADAEARTARRMRFLASGLAAAFMLALIAMFFGFRQFMNAQSARVASDYSAATATIAQGISQENEATAVAAQATSNANSRDAQLQASMAVAAQQTSNANSELAATREGQAFDNAQAAVGTSSAQDATLVAGEAIFAMLTATTLPSTETPAPTPTAESSPTSGIIILTDSLPTPSPTKTTSPTASPTTIPTPTSTPEASRVRTLRVGRTVEGETIEAAIFGNGPNNIVFVGGIHAGFAPGTVVLAEQAITYFSRYPEEVPEDATLIIIPEVNIDSELAPGQLKGRLNANGVDLNRNWGCDWTKDASWAGYVIPNSGGEEPFSEPETLSLAQFLRRIDPKAVIFWQARVTGGLASAGGCDKESLVSNPLARFYGQAAGYQVSLFDTLTGQTVNGDASNSLDEMGIPAASVLLPTYEETDWENNLAGIQAVLKFYGEG